MRKYEEFLKCDYSPAEMAEMATDLARSNQCRGSLEQQKKQIDSQLKSQIEEQNTIIGRLSSALVSRCEWRNVECRVELDTPGKGRKRIVRLDTGEEVRVILMTDEDRQMVMDLQEKAEAAEASAFAASNEGAKQEAIVTPPPVLTALPAPDSGSVTDGKSHADNGVEVTMSSDVAQEMISKAIDLHGGLASAVSMGGTHQKKRGKQAAAGDVE